LSLISDNRTNTSISGSVTPTPKSRVNSFSDYFSNPNSQASNSKLIPQDRGCIISNNVGHSENTQNKIDVSTQTVLDGFAVSKMITMVDILDLSLNDQAKKGIQDLAVKNIKNITD